MIQLGIGVTIRAVCTEHWSAKYTNNDTKKQQEAIEKFYGHVYLEIIWTI